MSKLTTRKASANIVMQSEAEDAQTGFVKRICEKEEKDLYEIIAIQGEIMFLKGKIEKQRKDTPAECGIPSLASPFLNCETSIEPALPHKWWIRDIKAIVPKFSGHNINISHFISACRRVQRLIDCPG